jgi:hypothetical protein
MNARYTLDVRRSVHTTGIADGVKHELSAFFDACHRVCIENRIETHSIGRQPGRRRQIPPRLQRMFVGVHNCMECRRHPVGSEGVAMTCFGQVSMVSSEIRLRKYRVFSRRSSSFGHSLTLFCTMRR